MFADVIPWALARYSDDGSIDEIDEDDLESALLATGRRALTRATHPENVRLKRIAFNEAAQFPEFNVSAESMMWAGRTRAVTELRRRHEELGTIKVETSNWRPRRSGNGRGGARMADFDQPGSGDDIPAPYFEPDEPDISTE